MRLAGKSAIVTGAGRGIGKATALRFAREGADVLVPDLDQETSQQTAREIQALGRKGVPMQMDVTRMADIRRMMDTALREFGKIDILVNNAGITLVRDPLQLTEEEWDRTMSVNAKAAFFCLQAVAREMVKRQSGVILNAASISGRSGKPMLVDYCASKFAVVGMTQSMALPWRSTAFGSTPWPRASWILTCGRASTGSGPPWRGSRTGTMKRTRVAAIPLGRIETPEDVANLYAFLASDEASYITGQTYNVCGGLQLN